MKQNLRKSLNDQKIARTVRILTIFGPKSSQRRNLFFENFSNERKNGQTNEKTEGTNENRIAQVVVIVGGVCGRRDMVIKGSGGQGPSPNSDNSAQMQKQQ